jgi:hypothetical protein
VAQRVAHGHRRIEADELRGHDAARRALGIAEETLHLRPHVGRQLGEEPAPRDLAHAAHDLRPLVGGESLEELGGATGLQLLHGRAPAPERRLVEHLDGAGDGEHAQHRSRFLEAELVQELGEIGGGQLPHRLSDADEALVQPETDALEEILVVGHALTRPRRSLSQHPRQP